MFKFVEHFAYIAAAMNRSGEGGMWDEEDGFYYDVLRLPDGSATRLKVRSLVGLLPLCATTVIEKEQRERVPTAMGYIQERMRRSPELLATIHPTGPGHLGVAERGVLAPGQPGAAPPDSHEDARRKRVPGAPRHPLDLEVSRAASVCLGGRRPGAPRGLSASRVRHRHVRWQLQLAWPGLDAGERAHHPGAAELLPVLRRQLQNRMPHRLRQTDEPVRG